MISASLNLESSICDELVAQSRRRSGYAKRHNWGHAHEISSRIVSALQPETMTASELMYFFDAPLAHVAQYEERLRASRRAKDLRRFARRQATRWRP